GKARPDRSYQSSSPALRTTISASSNMHVPLLSGASFGAIVLNMKRPVTPSTLESEARRYLEQHRGRRSRPAAPPAARAAERVLRPLAKRFGVGIEQLEQHWTEIVGARLARWCDPASIQRQGNVQTLVIQTRGPAGAILQAESRHILERVKLYAGHRAPTRLKVVQGRLGTKTPDTDAAAQPARPDPATLNRAKEMTDGVEQTTEARLLSALKRFDRSVQTRRNRT
uniref:DciA family protein n=1 Tax=Maricaulis sp. TaxID=1486257 RepID=UPI00260DC90B